MQETGSDSTGSVSYTHLVEYDGKTYNDGKNIPVKVGKNYITVKSTVQGENGQTATLTYRVNVHRRAADKTYYNEAYRNQYHYSVKDGWGNDLNGLVKYKMCIRDRYRREDQDVKRNCRI